MGGFASVGGYCVKACEDLDTDWVVVCIIPNVAREDRIAQVSTPKESCV